MYIFSLNTFNFCRFLYFDYVFLPHLAPQYWEISYSKILQTFLLYPVYILLNNAHVIVPYCETSGGDRSSECHLFYTIFIANNTMI